MVLALVHYAIEFTESRKEPFPYKKLIYAALDLDAESLKQNHIGGHHQHQIYKSHVEVETVLCKTDLCCAGSDDSG